jgi:hypothetical protein
VTLRARIACLVGSHSWTTVESFAPDDRPEDVVAVRECDVCGSSHGLRFRYDDADPFVVDSVDRVEPEDVERGERA